jgi:hypothetical protein
VTQFKIEYVTSMFLGRYKSPIRLGQASFHNGSAVRAVLDLLNGCDMPDWNTWAHRGGARWMVGVWRVAH